MDEIEKKLEQIDLIAYTILEDPEVDYSHVMEVAKLASEDKYLYDLMVDWAKEVNGDFQKELLNEMFNYTDEVKRRAGIRN